MVIMTIAQIHEMLLEEYFQFDHYVDELWAMTDGDQPTSIEDLATLQVFRALIDVCSPEQFELRKAALAARRAAAEAAEADEQDSDADEDPF